MYSALYQLLGWLTVVAVMPLFLAYTLVTGRGRQGLGERFGFLNGAGGEAGPRPCIWLHAASVGEVQVARALVGELRQRLPEARFVVSTVTEQGQKVARDQFGPDVRCIYAPLDLAGVVGRVVASLAPSLYICLETELWPNLFRSLRRAGVKSVLLNGRMSRRSYRRYRLVRGFVRQVLENFSALGVIGAEDAERYRELGAEPGRLKVTGNAKYDLAVADSGRIAGADCRVRLRIRDDQPLWVAGSTHTGEESVLCQVFTELKQTSGLRELVWLLAPRHLQRLHEIEAMLAARGIASERWSRLSDRPRRRDVVLIDEMGVLAGLYAAADYVFCGGSLVDRGGHNILEAAVHGCPVFFGPSMHDFADIADHFVENGAGYRIVDAGEITAIIRRLQARPAEKLAIGRRAREAALEMRGALQQQVSLALRVLHA